jgi:hypothetical protein
MNWAAHKAQERILKKKGKEIEIAFPLSLEVNGPKARGPNGSRGGDKARVSSSFSKHVT